MSARRSELQRLKRLQENPANSGVDRHPAGRSHLPANPHGRARPGDGSQLELDGIFGRPLGGRHAGCGEQRIQRPDMAPSRLSAYRSVAHDGALLAHRFRSPGNDSDVRRSQGLQQTWTVSISARFAPDTEIMEAVCNERPDSGQQHWIGRASDAQKSAVKVAPEVMAKYV